MKKLVTNVMAVDDLDGTTPASHTVKFSLPDGTYTLDLSEEHEHDLRELLKPYLAAATFRPLPSSAAADVEASTLQMREWARQHLRNADVPSRGPLPRAIVDAYAAQHPDEVVSPPA